MSLNEVVAATTRPLFGHGGAGADASVLMTSPALLDVLPIAIYACDAEGRILWFNRRAVELWGRTPVVGDAAERYCGSYKLWFDGRPIARDETPMACVLRTGEPVHGVEAKVGRPDGTFVWATVHIDPVRDGKGRIVGAINCFHDSTATHRLNESIRKSNQDLEDFFDNGAVGLHLVAADGTILRANKAELDMLGYSASEYVGRNIREFHADQDAIGDILACLKRGERLDKRPARLRAKDGSVKDVLITSNVQFRDGEFINTRCFIIDVSEWRRADEMLRQQDQRLAATYEHAAIGISELDADGRRLRVNEAACAIMGRTREDMIGSTPFTALHADEGDSDQTQHRRMVAGEIERYNCESRWLRPDGTVIWLEVVSSAVRDAAGRFLYCVRVFKDVTAARQAAEAIAENEQRLTATYEHAGIAISEVDASGRLLRVNETVCAITGYSREELLARTVFEITHPDDLASDLERFQAQTGEPRGRYLMEKRIIRKNGSILWVLVASSTVRNSRGEFRYGIRVMQDITERKLAEQRLRDSERQFRELLQALPAAVYTTDAHGRVNFFNQAAVALSGREPQLGTDEWCITWRLYRTDGTYLPHAECPMAVALKENRPVRGCEVLAERPDGTRVPVIPYPTPIHDADGQLTGAVNMLVDISERRQSEAHQKMLLAELNHRVKNNMQMLHSLLRTAQRETENAQARGVLADASQRVGAMAAAQQVLYDAGNTITYNANEFLQAVCAIARQAFGRNIEVTILPSTDEKLSNDTAMPLALILNELLTNAAKHGVNGRQEGAIRVQLTKSEESFVLTVEDDGPGFAPDRVHRRSSGLGLVIGLARQLGGTFKVENAAGKVENAAGARCMVRFVEQQTRH
jgi:PAS domain S-box-containing protein